MVEQATRGSLPPSINNNSSMFLVAQKYPRPACWTAHKLFVRHWCINPKTLFLLEQEEKEDFDQEVNDKMTKSGQDVLEGCV